jgi:DNA-binding transcriptional regulator YdaS (Cro superfamily)
METMSAFERAIKIAGGSSALAERIGGIKPQHIINWRSRGLPVDRVKAVVRAVDGKVTAHDLAPDLFPKGFVFPDEETAA